MDFKEEMLQRINDALFKERIPLKESASVSIAAGGSGSATITLTSGYLYFIKSWTVTKDADVTVTSITIDGNDTYQTDSLADTVSEYGDVIVASQNVVISGSNAGLAAENLSIEIKGFKIKIE
jgi:hypothetical protein